VPFEEAFFCTNVITGKSSGRGMNLRHAAIVMTETDDKILMQLGTAHHALAAARTIGDFNKIADVVAAAEMYARRVKLSQESVVHPHLFGPK
jgi:hypothetical protein